MTPHDLSTNPELHEELVTARRGTAFFSEKLDALSDADLDEDSLLPGWTRRHVVAHVAYNARALTRLVESAGTGEEIPMYESREARNNEIAAGAALDAGELRDLCRNATIHLNAEWRDLREALWSHQVKTSQGQMVPATETVWFRTREVWIHAVDLDNGASFDDIPASVLSRLLGDVTLAWKARGDDTGLRLSVTGDDVADRGDLDAADPEIVTGTLADMTAWACGRGQAGVSSSTRESPVAPRWL